MAWAKNGYSRTEIDRAGEILRSDLNEKDIFEYFRAYDVMNTWRSSHSFPLNTIQMSLRNRAHQIDPMSDVVQRLKRAPSVISKLQRYEGMLLSRMQDLGGCRSILSTVSNVYELRSLYAQSRDRHELATEKDYIANPQTSGYRGVHLIYRYRSDRAEDYNGHRIEVQLRTRVQHAWATAVEIAGVYVRTPLKSSIGPSDWLDFFRFASSAFSILEGSNKLHTGIADSEIVEQLRQISTSLDARGKLRTFAAAHNYIADTKRKSDSHFILILNLRDQKTTIEAFGSVVAASSRYAELEKQHIEDDLVDVVLVAAESIESATSAYPNYFVDTSAFLSLLDALLDG
jgi:ppGpp synthetase/RelA/SpoT-type nucleotidyltranferase